MYSDECKVFAVCSYCRKRQNVQTEDAKVNPRGWGDSYNCESFHLGTGKYPGIVSRQVCFTLTNWRKIFWVFSIYCTGAGYVPLRFFNVR